MASKTPAKQFGKRLTRRVGRIGTILAVTTKMRLPGKAELPTRPMDNGNGVAGGQSAPPA